MKIYKMIFLTFLSGKGASNRALPLAADSLEQKASSSQDIKASNDDFHLSLPQYETPENEIHQKSAPGSSSSLDELCGRKKNKSKFSKKLFGKDSVETQQNHENSKSMENIQNGKETTVKENDVDIDICPIDHVPHNNEPDIDIYPLDQEVPVPAAVDHSENQFADGLNKQVASSGLDSKDGSNSVDGGSGMDPETVTITTNHVKNETIASSGNEHSASDELYQRVLSGNMEVTIPNMAKIVRIFTSSTFTGTCNK